MSKGIETMDNLQDLMNFISGKKYDFENGDYPYLPDNVLAGRSCHYILMSKKYNDLFLAKSNGSDWWTFSHNWDGCAEPFPTLSEAYSWCELHPEIMQSHQLKPVKIVESNIRLLSMKED